MSALNPRGDKAAVAALFEEAREKAKKVVFKTRQKPTAKAQDIIELGKETAKLTEKLLEADKDVRLETLGPKGPGDAELHDTPTESDERAGVPEVEEGFEDTVAALEELERACSHARFCAWYEDKDQGGKAVAEFVTSIVGAFALYLSRCSDGGGSQ